MLVLTKRQIDGLREIINIGAGTGTDALNLILGSHVQFNQPEIVLTTISDAEQELPFADRDNLAAIELEYNGNFGGGASLMMPINAADKIVSTMVSSEAAAHVPGDRLRKETLVELGNIVINAILGEISNIFMFNLEYSVPKYFEGKLEDHFERFNIQNDEPVIAAISHFRIDKISVEGDIILFLTIDSTVSLLDVIDTILDVEEV